MIIRPMTEEDVEAVFLIEEASFPDPWSRKSIRGTLRENCSYMLIAEEDSKIAGFLNSTYLFDELNLNRIAVLKEFQRKSVGTLLMNNMLDFCKENGIKRVMLEVRKSNIPAQGLYNSFGFISLGERQNFYQNPLESAVIMEKIMEE